MLPSAIQEVPAKQTYGYDTKGSDRLTTLWHWIAQLQSIAATIVGRLCSHGGWRRFGPRAGCPYSNGP